MYNITRSDTLGFTWFVIPKTGSRSLYSLLRPQVSKTRYDILPEPADLNTDFWFTIVRHPLDRLVSGWANKVQTGRLYQDYQNRPFKDFVDFVCNQDAYSLDIHFRPQHLMLPAQRLDFVGRHENYANDIGVILKRVGVKPPKELPRLNTSVRGSWRAYYTKADLRKATGYYVNDFWELGY